VTRIGTALVARTSVRMAMAALMVVPTILCAVLLGAAIHGRLATVDKQEQTVRAIAVARSLQTLTGALESEASPSVAAYVLHSQSPTNKKLAPLLTVEFGPAQLRSSRAATDRAIAALPASIIDAPQITSLRASLATVRNSVDAGQGHITPIFSAMQSMITAIGALEQDRLTDAVNGGTSRATIQVLQQMALSASLLLTADQLNRTATAYRLEGPRGAQEFRIQFLQTWGAYQLLAQSFGRLATGPVLKQWNATEATPAAKQIASAFETSAIATTPPPPVSVTTLPEEITLKQLANTHEEGIQAVSNQAQAVAQHTIGELRHDATVQLWMLSVTIAVIALLLVLLLFAITRAITRPLLLLAEEARQVSEGVLVDVRPSGPREVQVVGRALRAAVDSLRQLQSQVEAVARGDLADPTLENPLPGPLGEVMHSSVDAVVTTLRERDVLQEQLAHQATHDALTDLPNRAETYRQIEAALQRTRRTDRTVGLLFLDLDRFKAVNDTYGHHAGDQVLETVARRLINLVRAGDLVGRLGGDEFVIVTETVRRREDLRELAERVIATVNLPVPLKGASESVARVGVSIGVAMEFDGFVSAAQFVVTADTALYRAKTSQLGTAVFAEDAATDPAELGEFVPFARHQSADQ
jgi:diguanylate cyclase (GGDEF)-like protein